MIKEGNTYKKDKAEDIAIEIGDSKQQDFYPQFKTLHWDNECNFSLRLNEDITGSTYKEKDGVIEWVDKSKKKTARFYDVQTNDESGGFEFEVEFAEQPASNVVEFTLQSKGFKFLKQGELTDEHKALGYKRPDDIINSIAVYHDSKKNNKYKTGKAFHIKRIFVIDSNGWNVWCDQDIIGDTYKITMPQDFLDNAVYPIILDPSFGYTTIGGSLGYGARDKSYSASKFTMPESGTIDTINYYAELLSSRQKSAAIYDDSSGSPLNLLDESAQTSTGGGGTQWWNSTVNYVNSSGAVVMWLFARSSWDFYIAYDSGDTGQSAYKDDSAAASMVYEDPMTSTSLFIWDDVLSIYADYTASGGGVKQLGLLGVG